MVTIHPFKALRYDTKATPIESLVAPPYDVINPAEQEALYAKSAHNVVRLILGKDGVEDGKNRYEAAASFLERWEAEGVLNLDNEASFYVYEQEFTFPGTEDTVKRTALFALLEVEEFSTGNILPHEKTFPKAKADRLALLRATQTNLSPIFGIYSDASEVVRSESQQVKTGTPLLAFVDDKQIGHKMWALRDKNAVASVQKAFADYKVLIADGHHRFETALNYSNEQKLTAEALPGSGSVMIALVAMEDPGLAVLPTHRMIKAREGFSPKTLIKNLEADFEITAVNKKDALDRLDAFSEQDRVFAFYTKDEAYILKACSLEDIQKKLSVDASGGGVCMEVSLVTEFVLKLVTGGEPAVEEEMVSFTRSSEEAFALVDSGEFACSVLMRNIPVDQVRRVCEQQFRLPHKSTYFFPKFPSGLLFFKHASFTSDMNQEA